MARWEGTVERAERVRTTDALRLAALASEAGMLSIESLFRSSQIGLDGR